MDYLRIYKNIFSRLLLSVLLSPTCLSLTELYESIAWKMANNRIRYGSYVLVHDGFSKLETSNVSIDSIFIARY